MSTRPYHRAWLCSIAVLCLGFVQPPVAAGHALRTAYLEVTEHAAGQAVVRFRLPKPEANVRPRLPEDCELTRLAPSTTTDSGELATWNARCDRALAGRTLAVMGLGPSISEAVIFYTSPSGTSSSALVVASESRWSVPEAPGGFDVASRYMALGFEHIVAGYDHLLFVFLLVLWVRNLRGVLIAESAFTLSHTLSFSLTSLGLVRVPAAPAEACIALSLLLMALDVDAAHTTRAPSTGAAAITALVFGLVHGLGFAGALRETGLPDTQAAQALVSFGLGVEAGQLGFALLCLLLIGWARRFGTYPKLAGASTYVIGTTAAYWLFERLAVAVAVTVIIAGCWIPSSLPHME